MIDKIRGVAALRELATFLQNLEKKLGLPVSLEVVQEIAKTADGYKYLSKIEGKLLEILSKKELDVGSRYWAEGTKNEAKNTLVLENIVQKPHLLQSELFRSETLLRALNLEKLVEILKADSKEPILPPLAQRVQIAEKQPQNTIAKSEVVQSKIAKNGEQPTVEPFLHKSVLRLEGAKLTLSEAVGNLVKKEPPKEVAFNLQQREESAPQREATTVQKQTVSPYTQAAKQKLIAAADTLLDEKTVALDVQKKGEEIFKKEEIPPKDEVSKDTAKEPSNKESFKREILSKIKERVRLILEAQQAPLKKLYEQKNEFLIEPREFKNILAPPNPPTKGELEKAKSDRLATQKEQKISSLESPPDPKKVEIAEVISDILANSVQIEDKSLIASAVEKILKAFFGDLPTLESDRAILEVLEEVLEKMEAKERGEGFIKEGEELSQKVKEEQKGVELDGAKIEERGEQKSENPASKLKAALLEELSKVTTKSEFQILSQVAIALNREIFTFVLKDKGVVQFKKGWRDGELNAKRVEFYSAFETLGPICGEIIYGGGSTILSIYAEFESTYKILKETVSELSYFDQKNVSIRHGIREISEIKNSFLDTTG